MHTNNKQSIVVVTQEEQSASLSTSDFLTMLSSSRLEPYRHTFKPSNDEELLGAYQWGQAVSTSLHPLLGLLEVILRNAIHRSLSIQCSDKASKSFPWYDKTAHNHGVSLKGKSLAKVDALLKDGELRKLIQPTPDQVVSRLSFGFWPNVMDELNKRYAPKTFTDVFCSHPHSKPQHWSKDSNKEQIVLRLKKLQDLRNRVCHFEAIWKPHWLGVSGANWSHSVKGIRDLHDSLVELLSWCSPTAVIHYKASFGWKWFNRLCTTNAVRSFIADHSNSALLAEFEAN